MSEATARPRIEEHLERMSRMAEEMRALLDASGRAQAFPTIVAGLRQFSSTLLHIKKEVEDLKEHSEHSEQQRRNLEALVEVGQVINSSLDLQTVLNEVMDTLIRLTEAERAFLMLRDDQGEMSTLVARNWEQEAVEPGEYAISRTIVDRVVRQGEAVLTTNALTDTRFGRQESVVAYNLRSILCVPLKVKGQLTGVIYADNRAREGLFTERERELVSAFANQAAVALENARLFESVRHTLAEVTELKNLMEDVFASIASGVITADIADVIQLCNRAAEAILARPSAALIGSSLASLLPPLSPVLPEKVDEVKRADQRYIGLEVNPVLPERGPVTLSLNLSPLKTAEDKTRGVAIVIDDLTEKRRLEAQRRLFERMVSPAVIDQIDPDSLQIGGRRMEITTLFADIRGFTSFGEKLDPEMLVEVLNRYLAAAAEAVLKEEGTIDKFLGDAVMAWFNAPLPQPDHTLRAARAALGIREAVRALHREMESSLRLSFGVGIHVGEAVLGFIGTQRRLDYTAIGDSVNTAKRLQEHAAEGQILISRLAAQPIMDQLELRPAPSVMAEGKGWPVEVFELVGLKG